MVSVGCVLGGAGAGAAGEMADTDPRYPRSSIEDDFNYGSCVASASVHIRMGMRRVARGTREEISFSSDRSPA